MDYGNVKILAERVEEFNERMEAAGLPIWAELAPAFYELRYRGVTGSAYWWTGDGYEPTLTSKQRKQADKIIRWGMGEDKADPDYFNLVIHPKRIDAVNEAFAQLLPQLRIWANAEGGLWYIGCPIGRPSLHSSWWWWQAPEYEPILSPKDRKLANQIIRYGAKK